MGSNTAKPPKDARVIQAQCVDFCYDTGEIDARNSSVLRHKTSLRVKFGRMTNMARKPHSDPHVHLSYMTAGQPLTLAYRPDIV